jgi:hypothetical protein
MGTALILWIGGGVAVGIVALFVVRRKPRGPIDLGSVSTGWTTEHNATTHGRDTTS